MLTRRAVHRASWHAHCCRVIEPMARCCEREGERMLERRSSSSRAPITYLRHAALHPYNLPLLVLAVATGLISGSVSILLVAFVAEVAVLSIVPRLRAFRHHVDEVLDMADRAEAARSRAALLMRMDEMHREELERLEHLADRIRENMRRHVGSAELVLDECFGLPKLLASYARLAIAFRACKEALSSVNRQTLRDKIQHLEMLAESATERVRKLAVRRLGIAIKRAEQWDRAQDDMEAIAHQLATIGELIHLMHEQSITPVDPQGMSDEIDRFLSDLEDSDGALAELRSLDTAEDVEPNVLELGRAPRRMAV
jgi:hypothetical protein